MTIYDCLFLNRHLKSKWTLFQDLDEVIWVPPRWESLAHLLSRVEENYDAVSFGRWHANVTVCRPRTVHFPTLIDRMNVFHAQPHCGELCRAWKGLRKYAAKPSTVEYLYIHQPDFQTQKDRALLDLKISKGFLRHYWAVASLTRYPFPCKDVSFRKTLSTAAWTIEEFKPPRLYKNTTTS